MVAGYESISSPDHETLGLSSAEQLDAIFQKIDENGDGRISKQELIAAVHHEFYNAVAGCSSDKSQLQASSTVVPLLEVICCDAGGTKKQNAESNLETMLAKVGGVGGSSAEDGNATVVVGYSFDGAGVKGNGDGAAPAVNRAGVKGNVDGAAPAVNGAGAKDNGDGAAPAVGGDSFDGAGAEGNGDGAAIVGDDGGANCIVLMRVKAGSFALCLLSFFIDKQLSFSSRDTLYLRIAFFCGLLAFFVASWHVPNADATLRAQDMQEKAVITLLIGVLTVTVIALADEFRVPMLICCIAFVRIGWRLEED